MGFNRVSWFFGCPYYYPLDYRLGRMAMSNYHYAFGGGLFWCKWSESVGWIYKDKCDRCKRHIYADAINQPYKYVDGKVIKVSAL